MSRRPVMIVDDCKDDKHLLRLAFRAAGVEQPLVELESGDEAQKYLSGEGPYSDRRLYPLPCVVITDLKMPKMDGFDLLGWMRAQPALGGVPRLVLSGSGEDGDRKRANQLGACGYYVKPSGVRQLVDVVKHMDAHWIEEHCGRG